MSDDGFTPSPQLRYVWKVNRQNEWGEVLQQLWTKPSVSATGGWLIGYEEEWRDVPIEQEQGINNG